MRRALLLPFLVALVLVLAGATFTSHSRLAPETVATEAAASDPALWYETGGKTDLFHAFDKNMDPEILGDGRPDVVSGSDPNYNPLQYQQFSLPGQMVGKSGTVYDGRFQVGGYYVPGEGPLWWITHRGFIPGAQ
jgi:hypothetical protein